MKPNILTSELDIQINREDILKDYDIHKIIPNDNEHNYKIISNEKVLKLLTKSESFNLSEHGLFVLTKKYIVKTEEIRKYLLDFPKSQVVCVDLFMEPISNYGISDHHLLQLFTNTLSNPRTKYPDIYKSHITDRLIYAVKNKYEDSIDGAGVRIVPPLTLQISFSRYLKITRKTATAIYRKQTVYIYDFQRCLFIKRQQTEGDNKCVYFIKENDSEKRVMVPFINFTSKKEFMKSRVGFFRQFMKETQKRLSDYFSLKLIKRTPKKYGLHKPLLFLERDGYLKEKIGTHPITITDGIKNKESSQMINSIIQLAGKCLSITIKKTDQSINRSGHYQINLIHNKKYYGKQKAMKDPYIRTDQNGPVQNITLEDYTPVKETKVKTIIKELVLKKDVIQKRITFFDDYDQLNRFENFQFILWKTVQKTQMKLCVLKLGKNGKISFKTYDQNNIIDVPDYIISIWNQLIHPGDKNFEIFIINEQSQINYIEDTKIITIPDFGLIFKEICRVEENFPEFANTYRKMAKILLEIRKEPNVEKHHGEDLLKLINRLQKKPETPLNKQTFRKILNTHLHKNCTENKAIRRILYEKFNITLHFSKSKTKKEQMFLSNLDLYTIKTEEPNSLRYYEGIRNQNLKYQIPFASHIRKIAPLENAPLFADKLLFMMDVDFVRTSDRTVLPFPAKYIREYMKISENENAT